jgi:sugar phosphate isomerase/epimerase
MNDWPVGLSTGCFYKRHIMQCLETIRKGGFCMIEVCSFPAHLDYHDKAIVKKAGQMMKDLGMEAYSFHAPFSDDIDITSLDPSVRSFAIKEMMSAAESAAMMGARYLVIHPGPEKVIRPSAEERLARMKNAAESLQHLSLQCQSLGMSLMLENMLPHLLFGNISDMSWIMGAVHEMNLGACLDTGHAHLSNSLYHVMRRLSGHLRLIHVNDNLGKNDDHVPPGQGQIDWIRVMRGLQELHFRGGIIVELASRQEKDMESVLDEARQARLFLRDISKNLYLSCCE